MKTDWASSHQEQYETGTYTENKVQILFKVHKGLTGNGSNFQKQIKCILFLTPNPGDRWYKEGNRKETHGQFFFLKK